MTLQCSTVLAPGCRLSATGRVLVAILLVGFCSTACKALAQQNGSYVPNAVNRMPDANERDKMQQARADDQRIESANAERKKQICADSEKLLKMATDLKGDLEKTSKDTLSVDTIHKIDAIQKLAKDMKDKLRLRSN